MPVPHRVYAYIQAFLDKLLERLLTRNWRILLSFVLEFACCQIPWFFCRNLEFCPKLIKLHNFRYNIYLKLYFWTKIPEHFINSALADSLKVLDQIPWVFRRITWVFLEERFFVLKWKNEVELAELTVFAKFLEFFFFEHQLEFSSLGFFFRAAKKSLISTNLVIFLVLLLSTIFYEKYLPRRFFRF